MIMNAKCVFFAREILINYLGIIADDDYICFVIASIHEQKIFFEIHWPSGL